MGARLAAVMGLWALCQCSHAPTPSPGAWGLAASGVALSAEQARACRVAMVRAQLPLQQVSVGAKTSRFGPEGRARVTLQLALQRPNLFRLTVLGPHGPPLYAAACDGAQLTSLDVASKVFRTQPATAAGIAHHLGGLELGLSAEDWLGLLLGEMAVPEGARAYAQGAPSAPAAVTWRWVVQGRTVAAEFDGTTHLLRRVDIAFCDGRLGSVTLNGRGPLGLPEKIALHLGPAPGGKDGAQDVELNVVDVKPLPAPLPPQAFVLAAPVAVPSL